MSRSGWLVAAIAACSASTAVADVAGAAGGLQVSSSFLELTSANVLGGTIYEESNAGVPNVADRPELGTVGNWVAAGPSNTGNGGPIDATLTLPTGTTYVSFAWGSVDPFNVLTVNTNDGSRNFTGADLGILASASYVHFTPTGGSASIRSLVFRSPDLNAFEVANVTAVPEPGSTALALAGLAAVVAVVRRRRPR